MDEYVLRYEEPRHEAEAQPPAPLYDTNYACEYEGCPNDGPIDWVARDEDGHIYYTYRCSEHPAEDPEYSVSEL